ncbi:MAG TPA: winged helix-turn-helix domain-containing protein [Mucilaginibacter sp.]|jgi:DNA-binding winged helix-turn-helix (wHTH) protein|nr:winged helix-turn-helix domain-containing protein [Mucilaginibacter sp.]
MLINGRFDVDSLRNEVTDKQTGRLSRIEPRLMKLLCLLIEHQGKPVSRKTIIKEIWNDYPGGDEGLNQAISVLRKLLDDNQKKIIETLPKTGYCFHGTTGPVPKRKPLKIIYVAAALSLMLIIALVLGYHNYHTDNKIVPAKLSHEEAVKAFKIDSKEGAKAVKMDSLGKIDSKGNELLRRTDDEKRRAAGKADGRVK